LKEIKLPSGALLKINASPFAVSKALYQAILKECKEIDFNSKMEVSTLYKEIFCTGFSSPEIEKCLWECLKRCTYNDGKGDLKIDDQTFEPVANREDYMKVCIEVTKENVLPFGKSLYAEFQLILATTENTPA
jgi:hypothetical protein